MPLIQIWEPVLQSACRVDDLFFREATGKRDNNHGPFAVFLVPAIIAAEVLGHLRKHFGKNVEAAMRGGAYEDEAVSAGFAFLRRPPGSLHGKSPGNTCGCDKLWRMSACGASKLMRA